MAAEHKWPGRRNEQCWNQTRKRCPQPRQSPSCAPCCWKTTQLDAELVLRALRKDNFDVSASVVQDEAGFTQALRDHCPEIVLADYNLPSWTGMEALDVLAAGRVWISR